MKVRVVPVAVVLAPIPKEMGTHVIAKVRVLSNDGAFVKELYCKVCDAVRTIRINPLNGKGICRYCLEDYPELIAVDET